jgi:hypothetical protein
MTTDTHQAPAHGHNERRLSGLRDLTVRRAILIRAELGAVCAVEYLRPRGIGADVIARVLEGAHMRAEDALALAQLNGQASS